MPNITSNFTGTVVAELAFLEITLPQTWAIQIITIFSKNDAVLVDWKNADSRSLLQGMGTCMHPSSPRRCRFRESGGGKSLLVRLMPANGGSPLLQSCPRRGARKSDYAFRTDPQTQLKNFDTRPRCHTNDYRQYVYPNH